MVDLAQLKQDMQVQVVGPLPKQPVTHDQMAHVILQLIAAIEDLQQQLQGTSGQGA